MASRLNKSVKLARKGIIVFLLFAAAVFIFEIVLESIGTEPIVPGSPDDISASLYERPNSALGLIPMPEIDSIPTSQDIPPSYGLSDRTDFPEFESAYRVYEIIEPRKRLGNTSKAKDVAQKLGFESQETILDDNLLYWETTGQTKTLFYNEVQESWDFQINLNREFIPISERDDYAIELEALAYNGVGESLLSRLGFLTSDFVVPNSDIHFVNYTNDGRIEEQTDPLQTDYVRIGLFKRIILAGFPPDANINLTHDKPQYSDVKKLDFTKAPVEFVVRGRGQEANRDIIEFEYQEFKFDDYGVYTSITPLQAWQDIQRGEGKLVWLQPKSKGFFEPYELVEVATFTVEADMTEVIYLEPDKWDDNKLWTHYLQPFYLFQGKALLASGEVAEFAIIIEALTATSYITPQ